MASAACINTEGVPVEFNVATILLAIIALFPIPVMITRPLDLYISSTASANFSSIKSASLEIAKLSIAMVSLANATMEFFELNFFIFWLCTYLNISTFKSHYKKTKKIGVFLILFQF